MEKKRIPIDTVLSSRDSTLTYDGLMVNCYTESSTMGKMVVKRPGLTALTTYSGACQGAYNFLGTAYYIFSDTLYPSATPLSPGTSGQPFAFSVLQAQGSSPAVLFFSSPTDAYTWNGTTLTKVTNSNYPAATVPGNVTLDTTTYVLSTNGAIYGSSLNDPTTWSATNFIGANEQGDTPVYLGRQLNYVVALRERSMQFFYDAGNAAPGSPLSSVPSASQTTGCASAASVRNMGNSLYFVAKSNSFGHTVVRMDGFEAVKISNAYIERLLDADGLSSVYSKQFKIGGHSWYVLTLNTLGIEIAYDDVEQEWCQLSFSTGPYNHSTYDGTSTILGHPSNGSVVRMSPTAYSDIGSMINVTIRTYLLDFSSMKIKFWRRFEYVGDGESTSVQVSYSDNDYQSWSTPVTLSVGIDRTQSTRWGSSRRRAWKVTHSDNTPFRMLAIEVDFDEGVR